MPVKFNNTITVRLTNEQSNFLINLMNDNFCIDSMADAIRYCINTEIHYAKLSKEQICEQKDRKKHTIKSQ